MRHDRWDDLTRPLDNMQPLVARVSFFWRMIFTSQLVSSLTDGPKRVNLVSTCVTPSGSAGYMQPPIALYLPAEKPLAA